MDDLAAHPTVKSVDMVKDAIHASGFYARLKNSVSKRAAKDQRQTKVIKKF
ncbi:MAG: hypothetical protein JKY31_08770 [Rhodobacteraceae bacterium]|nr:hypothetical protein [Paracoccaceae bacterium]